MLAAQAVLMRESASQASAEAFIATRYDSEWGRVFGSLDARVDCGAVLAQAWQA
jgi:putative acyl-CoA dehydrogenase